VQVTRLRLDGLRILQGLELEPGPRWNSLIGPNGSGKTSILEGLFLLGHGRSFRKGGVDALIRRGEEGLSAFAEVQLSGQTHRIGLSRSSREWQARVDGEAVSSLGQLFSRAPVLCFEPDSHDLISGSGDERRRFLDWGLFHVEPDFLLSWRRYQRALRQRNALLKHPGRHNELSLWDAEFSVCGVRLDALRQAYVESLRPELELLVSELVPELGPAKLRYLSGWRSDERSLEEALEACHERDRLQGNTSVGPHRADLVLSYSGLSTREQFSRGQEKLSALSLRLAQARLHAQRTDDWPLLLLDDLGSELDARHLQRALELIGRMPVQRWLTGTEPISLPDQSDDTVFHVEQGRVRRLL
jgi:DNA replication and repair protein RecF